MRIIANPEIIRDPAHANLLFEEEPQVVLVKPLTILSVLD